MEIRTEIKTANRVCVYNALLDSNWQHTSVRHSGCLGWVFLKESKDSLLVPKANLQFKIKTWRYSYSFN